MRFSEDMSFPHPVLAPWLTDFEGAAFDVSVLHREHRVSTQVAVACQATISQPDIETLISDGAASFGLFVSCESTNLRKLIPLAFPSGAHEFAPGALLNRVSLRPIVWTNEVVGDWSPRGMNPEFGESVTVRRGEILALGHEQIMDIAPAKIAPLETIFSLKPSDMLRDGELEVDLEQQKITILASPRTYRSINEIRTSADGVSVAMASVYSPVVMRVLDAIREGSSNFDGFRWYRPFMDRCSKLELDFGSLDILRDAAALLDFPINRIPIPHGDVI